MIDEAADAGNELAELELAREKRKVEAEKKKKEEDKNAALEKAKKRIKQIKYEDRKMVESIQRDARNRRLKKERAKLEKNWEKYWDTRRLEMLEAGKKGADEFLKSKDSFEQMELRFRKLKREFYMPPCPENREREKIITNPANITMLYLHAKMETEDLLLKNVVPKFDVGKKGYLTHDEFRAMVKALKVPISPTQVVHTAHTYSTNTVLAQY